MIFGDVLHVDLAESSVRQANRNLNDLVVRSYGKNHDNNRDTLSRLVNGEYLRVGE